ncbi:MAG: hypothetical protein HGA19_06045 [Oscillochloris sp.]|nr:hypothetical protein [Oscillochloris sp.]
MPGIIDDLPKVTALSGLGDRFTFDPQALGLGGLQGLNVADMASSIKGIALGDTLSNISLPALPASLSKEGFLASINQPLGKLTSLNSATVLGDLSNGVLPVDLPEPGFDLNTPIAAITAAILPNTGSVKAPSFHTNISGFDFSAMVEPLNQLARAGAATPTRLLFMLMRIGQNLVDTLTDTDKLTALTIESLEEIYSQQILTLQSRLPLYVLGNAASLLGTAGSAKAFSARYKLLLDEIETIEPTDTERLKRLLQEGRQQILPSLYAFEQARLTLVSLKANDTAPLSAALTHVLELTAADQVLLQKYFDIVGTKADQVLGAIAGPVTQIGDMAGKIQDFLTKAGDTAESTANNVSQQIEDNLGKVGQFLADLETRLSDLETQIKAFIAKVDVATLVNKAKFGCAKIAEAVELFFSKVEELKLKLDAAVHQLGVAVDQKLTDAFKAAEEQIRALLGQITGVLNRPEIQQALKEAREGIEKFKTTVEQASLKPVFDLVITQTNKLETSVKSLNVAQMSTPQKTALKVGAKVIEQVKVDEIIKPELMDAFEQIRAPLAELITLLKEKVLQVEQLIMEFNPGTVVNNYIVGSGPYQTVMGFLDEFRPSKLLAPLKDANDQLTSLVQQLNPDLLINEVQKIYQKVASLLEILNPAPLNRLISDTIDGAVTMLVRIRDQELDSLLTTVKQTISIENLMAKTGLQEIANADFWDLLHGILGGAYLEKISAALVQVETLLKSRLSSLDFARSLEALSQTANAMDKQLKVDAALIARRADELQMLFTREAAALKQLEDRRAALRLHGTVFPELTALLGELDLAPVLACQNAVTAVAEWESEPLGTAITAVNAILSPKYPALRNLGRGSFADAALIIFRQQISDPVNQLIARIRNDLKPFTIALEKIQGILTTLLALPPKIDAAVAKVLDTTRDQLKQILTRTINLLQSFQQSLTSVLSSIYARIQAIIGDLSPIWLLNSCAPSDFSGGTADEHATPPGMIRLARRIVSGRDLNDTWSIAALLQSKLSANQLTLLQNEATDTATTLQQGSRDNVLLAVNTALHDPKLCAHETVDDLKVALKERIDTLKSKQPPEVADIKQSYRLNALLTQISGAWAIYNSNRGNEQAQIRLNRIILEAAYPDDISMSLQSLHPFIVENVAHLYPEQTVQELDKIYLATLDKVKKLPDQLIRAPLDDEFNKIKQVLKENFDIAGVFKVLEIKIDGLDEDLAQGLDRLSIAYNHLLQTFDQRLAS